MPLRTKQQMVDEEAACHALTVIQVHKQRKEARVTPFISSAFFCCMHKQCSLFRSHCILLFMSRQELRYRITDSLRLEEYIHCDRDGMAAQVRIPAALHAGRALS